MIRRSLIMNNPSHCFKTRYIKLHHIEFFVKIIKIHFDLYLRRFYFLILLTQ